MAPTKLRTRKKPNDGHGGNGAEDYMSDEIPEKDETEERLEKLLFGDDAGFLEGLKPRSTDQQLAVRLDSAEEDVEAAGDEDLTTIADENVGTHSVDGRC